MNVFRVWAPRASGVDVIVNEARVGMNETGGGWWEARVDHAYPGDDYRFSLDGGEPRPDPRSRWQPQGVHGPSRLVDDRFLWTDQNWNAMPLASAVIYELHIGTFTREGTFRAAIEKLDYLADLGITHIEMLPVAEAPGPWGWGYDGVDLFAPNHHYGTPDDLKALVDACHARGLAVLLDVVYNHLGPDGNYLGEFGPYTTEKYETPWGNSVNLDGALCDGVREFFIDNAVMWLRDYHFDGLRLDAVHALIDTGAYHFLEALSQRVKTLEAQTARRLVLIAESDLNDPRMVRPHEIGGYGLDAQWSDDFHHALHSLLTGERSGYYCDFGGLDRLAKAITQVFVYDGCYSEYRQRRHGRTPSGVPGYRFVVCTQNHDQVGNRAQGERLSHMCGMARSKMAAVLLFTSPFVPLIFQGEEWAASTPFLYFTQHEDNELGQAVSEGRKKEFSSFGWRPEEVPDPQDPETFQRSKLQWQEMHEGEHAEMLAWYRQLIRLRAATPDLRSCDLDQVAVEFNEREQWLLMKRGSIVVACNFGSDAWIAPLEDYPEVLLGTRGDFHANAQGLLLPPNSAVVLAARSSNLDRERGAARVLANGEQE